LPVFKKSGGITGTDVAPGLPSIEIPAPILKYRHLIWINNFVWNHRSSQ